jgi:predicted PurR-regulated permease PerM
MARAPQNDSAKAQTSPATAAAAPGLHPDLHAGHDHTAHYAAIQTRQLGRIAGSAAVLATLAGAVALWLLQEVLTPLIVAVFLMILVDALSRQVAKIAPKTPEWLRVTAAFILMIVLLAGAVTLVARSAPGFAAELGGAKHKLETTIDSVTGGLGLEVGPADTLLRGIDVKPYVSSAFKGVRHLATDMLFVVIYLGFLLASRSAFQHKIEMLFPDHESRGHAQRVFSKVRKGAEDYIGLQTLKAVALALVSFGIMAALGLHNAAFLAFLVLLVAYVPILGPAAAVVVPVLLAIMQFDLTWRPLVMFLSLQTLVVLLDSIIIPRLQAEKMDVDPVVVLLSLGFWSMIFGVAGALLSTPLTVIVIAIAAEAPPLRWLAVMLSKGGAAPQVKDAT